MADSSEPHSGRLGTRLALISAAIVALVLLTISALLNWPVRGDGPGVGASGKRGAAPVPPSVAAAGDGTCLDWHAPDAADIHSVSCDQPHLFEVAGRADLSPDFTRTATFPNTDQWEQLKQQRCTQVSSRYLDDRLDPHGRFGVGAFTPSEQGWKAGDRALHCGLQQPGPSGRLYRFTGKVADLDQSDTYPTGRCLGINGQAVTDPVQDCAQRHAVEITGLVNLGERFRDFPTPSDQDDFLAARCAELTAQYAGSRTSAADKGLIVYWDTRSIQSWEAGSRQVNCKVSAQLPDGTGLAAVSGSIRGVVRLDRTPAPPDAVPREPGVPATREW